MWQRAAALGTNSPLGSGAEHGSSAPVDQTSIFSAISSASSISVLKGVETDATNPLTDKTSVLPGRQMPVGATTAWEQALAKLSVADAKVVIQRLTGHLRQLEANGPASLPLTDVGAVNCIAVGRHVLHAQSDEVATTQLAIDGQIEERQVANAPFQLQPGADGPDMADPQRRLRATVLALGAGRSASGWV
jgi:hypothetical protein